VPRQLDALSNADTEPRSDLRGMHADSNGVAGWSDADAVADSNVVSTAGE
jgi:hypothetical protein